MWLKYNSLGPAHQLQTGDANPPSKSQALADKLNGHSRQVVVVRHDATDVAVKTAVSEHGRTGGGVGGVCGGLDSKRALRLPPAQLGVLLPSWCDALLNHAPLGGNDCSGCTDELIKHWGLPGKNKTCCFKVLHYH